MTVCRWSPGGPPPGWLAADTVVYAVGDVHGRADLLAELRAAIHADAAARPAARRVAVYLGDYLSRGPDSRGVVAMLRDQPLPGFDSIHLRGNHEDIVLRYAAGELDWGRHWLHYGGRAALATYGVIAPEDEDDASLEALRQAMLAALPPGHLDFLRRLSCSHHEGGYFFAHAGVRPGVLLAAQDPADLLWIRRDFLASPADHGAVVVHGHTSFAAPQIHANRIGLDTRAYDSGRLTCLYLAAADWGFLQTG